MLPWALFIAFTVTLSLPSCRAGESRTSSARPVILFVCEHGVGRSAIAAAHFNKLAREAGLDYRAEFRGADEVATTLPVAIRSGLASDGIDSAAMTPLRLRESDLEAAEQIIVLDAWLPNGEKFAAKLTHWNEIPSPGDDFAAARDDIQGRVARLVRLLDPPSN